jgi:LysM repeat protein
LKVAKHKVVKQQGSSTVTREHKLALIVGFSLILLVGVLISDHLSSARQAQVGGYGPGDFRIAEAPLLVPPDPLQREGLWPERGGGAAGYDTAAAVEIPELPSPIGTITSAAEPTQAPAPPPEPWHIDQSSGRQARGEDSEFDALLAKGRGLLVPVVQPEERARPAAPAPESAAPAFDWYTVQPGDSLYKIAAKVYGDGKRWRELVKDNADRVDASGSVRSGVKIRIRKQGAPAAAPPPAPRPAAPVAHTPVIRTVAMPAAKTGTYTVQRGDTLGVISQKTLGTSRRWQEIADLNGIEDGDHVPAGKVLKIPAR